jgi:peptidyl-prolyl cis-trans isomerase B (cyclophilin B)
MSRIALALALLLGLADVTGTQQTTKPAAPPTAQTPAAPAATTPAGPIIVMETAKGTIEFETFPKEAPRTVQQILSLVKRNFYNGQRFHRVVPKFVIQIGDPQTRDMTKRASWGSGSRAQSGKPIGVAEFSKTRTHVLGAVAMAHAGDAAKADSQFYITLSPQPGLDGKYTVFGRVITGMDVAAKIVEADMLKKMYVRAPAAAPPK